MVHKVTRNKKNHTKRKTFLIPKLCAITPHKRGPIRVPATTPVDNVPKAYPECFLGAWLAIKAVLFGT